MAVKLSLQPLRDRDQLLGIVLGQRDRRFDDLPARALIIGLSRVRMPETVPVEIGGGFVQITVAIGRLQQRETAVNQLTGNARAGVEAMGTCLNTCLVVTAFFIFRIGHRLALGADAILVGRRVPHRRCKSDAEDSRIRYQHASLHDRFLFQYLVLARRRADMVFCTNSPDTLRQSLCTFRTAVVTSAKAVSAGMRYRTFRKSNRY